jgi:S1-C subfamily serine protease
MGTARATSVSSACLMVALAAVGGCSTGAAENASPPTVAQPASPGSSTTSSMAMGAGGAASLSPQQLYKRSAPAVFEIYGNSPLNGGYGFGTGFLIDTKNGMGLTNAHVVAGLTATKAVFSDGSTSPLHVMALDPCADLAVVHPASTPPGVEALPLGDDTALQPGDSVTVLGYPESLAADFTATKLAITSGLVQATKVRAKPEPDLPDYPDTIQHAATINHGNSGGPLLDQGGTVVGVNTLTNQDATQGQYYSIGIHSAQKTIASLMAGKSQNDIGWALTVPQTLRDDLATMIEDHHLTGVVILDVDPGSAADRAGMVTGDMVTDLQSTETPDVASVCDVLNSVLPGKTLKVDGVHLLGAHAWRPFTVEFAAPGSH